MPTDESRNTDEVTVELNPEPSDSTGENLGGIPDRPADTAAKARWVDYLVAHGADRTYLEADTVHFDPTVGTHDVFDDDGELIGREPGSYVTAPALTLRDLVALAEKMGV